MVKNYLKLFEKCVDTVGKNSDNHSIGTKQRKTEIMLYKVKDIIHENGRFWVLRDKRAYTVMVSGITHSIGESAYPLTNDGLSIAKYRCNYLIKRHDTDDKVDTLFLKLSSKG